MCWGGLSKPLGDHEGKQLWEFMQWHYVKGCTIKRSDSFHFGSALQLSFVYIIILW